MENKIIFFTGAGVINRYDIVSSVSSLYLQMPENRLSEMDMLSLLEGLRPYTSVSQETKDRHNENIRRNNHV